MLVYRPRRWPNIKLTLVQYLVFAEMSLDIWTASSTSLEGLSSHSVIYKFVKSGQHRMYGSISYNIDRLANIGKMYCLEK